MRKEYNKSIIYIVAIIISILFFGTIYHFYDLRLYKDDSLMRAIAAGTYTGTPDGHLLYIKYIYGYGISFLYNWFPNINWYGMMYLAICISCMFFLLVRCYRTSGYLLKKFENTFFIIVLFIIVYYPILISGINFTYVAAILGCTAIFYSIMLKNVKTLSEKHFDCVIIVATTCLCYWIRCDVFYIEIVFILLVFGFDCAKNRFRGCCVRDTLSIILPIFCILFITEMVEYNAYSSEEWVEFNKYNESRSVLVDYHYEEWRRGDYSEVYETYGLNNAEGELLDYICLVVDDVDMYSLVNDLATLAIDRQEKIGFFSKIQTALIQLYNKVLVREYTLLNFIIITLLVVVLMKEAYAERNLLNNCYYIGSFTIYVMLWFYLAYKGRIIPRAGVSIELTYLAFLLGLYVQRKENEREQLDRSAILIKCFLGIICVYLVGYHILYQGWGTNEKEEGVSSITEYCMQHPDSFYFVAEGDYSIEEKNNFSSIAGAENIAYLGGWLSNSPLFVEKLKKNQVDGVQKALLEQNNVYYIDCTIDIKDKLFNYYIEQGNIVDYRCVDVINMEDGKEFHVYEFRRSEN